MSPAGRRTESAPRIVSKIDRNRDILEEMRDLSPCRDMFDLFEIFLNPPKVRIAPLARIGYTPAVVHP